MSNDKKEYKVLRPIGFSGRREVGEILELTEAEAENIGSDYVVPYTGEEAQEAPVDSDADVNANADDADAGDDLDNMEVKDLQALAKERGVKVPIRGKDKIIAALREAAAEADADVGTDAEGDDGAEPEEE